MNKPIINKTTETKLLSVVNNLPQSLMLTGKNGVGLGTIAKYIASLCNSTTRIVLPEKDEKIDIDKGVINVDSIRRLYDETKTKSATKRIIIIDCAERMTIQAQNAFLKLLEEPGEDIYFILVSHSKSKLLPTILSRVVDLEIKPISLDQSNKMLDKLNIKDEKKRTQLLFIAEGLPAELTRLSSNMTYFDKRSSMIKDARELLKGNTYQKLLIANKYKDDRIGSLIMLLDAANILKRTIVDNPKNEAIKKIDQLLEVYQRIESNGNIRLCLATLAL